MSGYEVYSLWMFMVTWLVVCHYQFLNYMYSALYRM